MQLLPVSRCAFDPAGRPCKLAVVLFEPLWLSILSVLILGGSASGVQDNAPLYCLVANETCYADTTCYPLLISIPKWCGNYSAGSCVWAKEQHCLSVLRTLKNRQPFKDCHCRQEQFDHGALQRCRHMQRFVQNHPCMERSTLPNPTNLTDTQNIKDQESDNDNDNEQSEDDVAGELPIGGALVSNENATVFCDELYDETPSCLNARKRCTTQQVCNSYFDQFRTFCKSRNSRCVAQAQDLAKCMEAFQEVSRHAPALFACRCDDQAGKQQRCDNVLRTFRTNACVQHLVPKCKMRTGIPLAQMEIANANANVGSTSAELTLQRIRTTTTMRPHTADFNFNAVSDCYDVVTDCYDNDTCRALLGGVVQSCRFSVSPKLNGALPARLSLNERCDSSLCLSAIYDFYAKVGRKYAHSAAFCKCPSPDSSDYSNCVKHLEYLRPSCVFARQPAPTCFELLHSCYNRNNSLCRETMKVFNFDCKFSPATDRSSNDSCVNGVQKCRQAILRMIPNGLITDTCTCDGMRNSSARDLCIDVQSKLYNNPCVAEALSVPQSARASGRFGFSQQRALSRPVFSQLPTGFNESSLSADVCERLPRYNKVTNDQYRLYDRYRLGINKEGGCTEIVRCGNSVARQASDLWCDSEVEDIAEASSKVRSRSHVAHLRPLAAACVNSVMQTTSFTVFSSWSQQCVCHYDELICSTAVSDNVRNAYAQDGVVLLHVGYSTTEMELLQSKTSEDFSAEVITDKLNLLLNGWNRVCSLQSVWEQVGHLMFEVRTEGHEYIESDAYCTNATKLLAYFINQRHPFITHELQLSILRSAVVQISEDPLFTTDYSSFKRYLLRMDDNEVADNEDYPSYPLPKNDQQTSTKQQHASRTKDARNRGEQWAINAGSTTAVSFVHSAMLILANFCFSILAVSF